MRLVAAVESHRMGNLVPDRVGRFKEDHLRYSPERARYEAGEFLNFGVQSNHVERWRARVLCRHVFNSMATAAIITNVFSTQSK